MSVAPVPAATRDFVRRLFGYGSVRAAIELLLGLRGVALAGMLGPTAFGTWALVRLLQQYLALAGLGVHRGLEVMVPAATGGEGRRLGRTALGFILAYGLGLAAALGLVAALAGPGHARLVCGLLAAVLVLERVWYYAVTYLRAAGSLKAFARAELAEAALQLALTLGLARVAGLPGAVAGYVLALAGALALVHGGGVPARPAWSLRRLRPLLGIGFPVAVSLTLQTALVSADRLVLGALAGIEALGQYAFAASFASLGASFGLVVRTVVFPQVFRTAGHGGTGELRRGLLALAWVLAPVLGALAFGLGPVLHAFVPRYAPAVGAARLFVLAGIAQGVIQLGMLGVTGAGRQAVLPRLTALAFVGSVLLAVVAIELGLGLTGLAAAALLSRSAFALALLRAAGLLGGVEGSSRWLLWFALPLAAVALAVLGSLLVPDPFGY